MYSSVMVKMRIYFGIFWALLVQFGLGIMCRSKSSNLEGPKIRGVDVEMGLYVIKYSTNFW